MLLKNCESIDYATLFPTGTLKGDVVKSNDSIELEFNGDWGSGQLKLYTLQNLRFYQLEAYVKRNVRVIHHEDKECSTVNSCYALAGRIQSEFHGVRKALEISGGYQNFIYKPVLADCHYVAPSASPLQMLHVEVDLDYYLSLLNLNEDWSDQLKERLFKKELVSGPDEMSITPYMHKAISELNNCPLAGPLRNLMLEAKMLELLAHQLGEFKQTVTRKKSSTVSKSERDKFYDLKEYLSRTYNNTHSLKSLSRAYGLNEFKLKRGFKDLFGQTVFGYIHSLKMQEAKMLMEDAGLNVSQVASRTGYKNPNHFSVAFKKQFGLNPSELKSRAIY